MNKALALEVTQISALRIESRLRLWLGLIVVAVVFTLVALLVIDTLYNPRHFTISRITLAGDAPHVDRETLYQSVVDMVDGNYFSLNSERIIATLSTLPWVETVRLRRQWPDTLMVHVEEYQPIALWGKDHWLTTTGKLVSLPLPENVALPQLDGPPEKAELVWETYQHWASLFASSGLRLGNMELSRQHLYKLELSYMSQGASASGGFEMILSESNADSQLNSFLESRRQSLIQNPGLIKTVDLRYPSGFAVSLYEPEKLVKSNK